MSFLPDFKLETYFSRWEFNTKYILCASDTESLSLKYLLELADDEDKKLLEEIKFLKENKVNAILDSNKFKLSKQKIDSHLNRVLNETDWRVLLILLDNPMVLNKEIAEKSNMSIDGIGSSLRRMYDYFEINQTKYKKVALIHKAVNISERI